MAGRRPSFGHVKRSFLAALKSAQSLTTAIQALPIKLKNSATIGLHPTHAGQVIELAFMGIVASWEEFLEQTLVRYVAGAKTAGGYTPTVKYGLAGGITHAYQLLAQNPKFDSTKDYLKVTDVKWVRMMADFFFTAHPYVCLQNRSDLLQHATSIRNRVAHDSVKCKKDFKETALHFLQPASKTLTQGYTPGDLLNSKVKRHFGQPAVQQGKTIFEAYTDFYQDLADQIVP